MNKKILTISLVAVAAVAASVFALSSVKHEDIFSAQANPTYKQITLTKANMIYEQEGDDGLFEFNGKCAFDTERDFKVPDGASYGPLVLGGDHIFAANSYVFWYFQFNLKLKGTKNQFEYISFFGTYDGTERAIQRNREHFGTNITYDADEDELIIPIYEDSGYQGCSMDYSELSIDRIVISYGC